MSYTLYGFETNIRTRIVRIVAELEGFELKHSEVVPKKKIGTAGYIAKCPESMGKVPGLEFPDGSFLIEMIAVCMYISNIKNKANLMGDGSNEQSTKIIQWMSWSNMELFVIIAKWFGPINYNNPTPPPYDEKAITTAKGISLGLLDALEKALEGRKYLVGDHLTLADLFVAMYNSRGLEFVLDAEWRQAHPNVTNHFNRVASEEVVKKIIPNFILIDQGMPVADPRLRK